jgi:hypothetical protein
MSRESWWAVYERHFGVVDRPDAELEVAQEMALAMQAETWFSKEGVKDCV